MATSSGPASVKWMVSADGIARPISAAAWRTGPTPEACASRALQHRVLLFQRGDLLVDLARGGGEAEGDDVEADDPGQEHAEHADPGAAAGHPHDQAGVGQLADGDRGAAGQRDQLAADGPLALRPRFGAARRPRGGTAGRGRRGDAGPRRVARSAAAGRRGFFRARGFLARRRGARGRRGRRGLAGGSGDGHQPASPVPSSSATLTATRRWAERERGLASTSSGPGATARRVSSSASGSWPQTQTGSSGGQTQPRALAARNCLTGRSSSEWKAIAPKRPPSGERCPRPAAAPRRAPRARR